MKCFANPFLLTGLAAAWFLSGCAHSERRIASEEDPVAKVRIATAGNNFPFNFPCDGNPNLLCGIEVELFQEVCRLAGLQCEWQKVDWAGSEGPLGAGGMLHRLVTPNARGGFDFDAAVSSVSNSPERRRQVLFTVGYYTAPHIFIGHENLSVRWRSDGFPQDVANFPGRKLRIATFPGFLMEELKRVHPSPRFLEFVEVSKGAELELVSGNIDLFFAWTGIEKNIKDRVSGGKAFKALSQAQTKLLDPFNAVGAATRIDRQGRAISERLNEGLIAARRNGTHRRIFLRWLNLDLWPCRQAPSLEGDPKCLSQPK